MAGETRWRKWPALRWQSASTTKQTRADLLCLGLLFILPASFFWRETLGVQGLGDQDAVFWFFPAYKFVVECISKGVMPFWTPYQYSGVPIFARWQAGMLDPFNWLHFAGPTSQTLTFSFLLAFAVAMVSMWWYARLIGLGRRAGMVAAIVYSLNGFVVARTLYPVFIHVIALAPLVLAITEKLYRDGRWRLVGLGAIVVAWQVFAGHPQPLVYSSLIVTAYAIFRGPWRREERRRSAWFMVQFGMMYLLGAGLSAIQLLPAAESAGRSVREQWTYEMFSLHSIHPATLLTAIIPFFHGGGQGAYQMPYWGISWHHNEEQLYLGTLAVALAAGGAVLAVRRRHSIGLFWAGVVIAGSLLTLGRYIEPLARALYQLPVLGQFRGSNRHWIEVVMAVSILAGMAVDHLLREPARASRSFALTVRLGAAVLTLIVAATGWMILRSPESSEAILRSLPGWQDLPLGFLDRAWLEMLIPLGMSLLVTTLLWLWTGSNRRQGWYLPLLAVLLVDYYLYAASAPITHEPGLESRIGQALPAEVLREEWHGTPARVHVQLAPQNGDFSPYWFAGQRMVTGYDPLVDRRYKQFSGVDEAGHSWLRTILLPRDRTLDLLSTRYLALPPDWDPGEIGQVAPIELAPERSIRGAAPPIPGDSIVVEAQPLPGSLASTASIRLDCGGKLVLESTLSTDRHLSTFGPFPALAGCAEPVEVTIFNRASGPLSIRGLWLATSAGARYPIVHQDHLQRSPDPRRWREVGRLNPLSPYADYRLYENRTSLPPAWLVERVEEAWDGDQLKLLRGEIRDRNGELFDPWTTALVDVSPPGVGREGAWYRQFLNPLTVNPSSPGDARVTDLQADQLTIEVDARRAAILVVSEIADPDWQATIDGQPIQWHRVDYLLRGLIIPPGVHEVRFSYRPVQIARGAVISLVAALIIAAVVTIDLYRHRSFTAAAA